MSLSKNPISAELIEILKSQVKSSEILTPSSAGYSKAIARWSDAAVKPAVSKVYMTLFVLSSMEEYIWLMKRVKTNEILSVGCCPACY